MAKDELHPWTKWIVAAFVVLTILILAYQRGGRLDLNEPAMRSAEPPDVPAAPGELKPSRQIEGVRTQKPVLLQQDDNGKPAVP